MSVAAGQFFESVEEQPRAPAQMERRSTAAGQRTRTAAPRPASRVGTAMAGGGQRVGTALRVSERPVTKQGLSGVRPRTGGVGNRQVQDKSYWMGLLRGKITELNTEISRLSADVDHYDKERNSYVIYEQKAETMAKELREQQGVLADFNMVIDRMNTNTDLSDVQAELDMVRRQNEEEQGVVDGLFADRREKEQRCRALETELESKRRQADSVLTNMDPMIRDRYEQLKHENEELGIELRERQEELQDLTQKKGDMEDEVTVSTIKQEAMMLHERLQEAEAKRDAILAEVNAEGTPEEQRERILAKVRKDNEEIAAIERQISEARDKRESALEEMRELEEELRDAQGEKNEKYRELRLKETQIDEFLDSFEASKREELGRVASLQNGISTVLATISVNVQEDDLGLAAGVGMEESLAGGFKRGPRNTIPELQAEIVRLEDELERLEEVDRKTEDESNTLKTKLHQMAEEMDKFKDIESLRESAAAKQNALEQERAGLDGEVRSVAEARTAVEQELSGLQRRLLESDQIQQVVNLEKKLQYVEQNNFAVREVTEARQAETNFGPIKEQVMSMVTEHNQFLSQKSGKTSILG